MARAATRPARLARRDGERLGAADSTLGQLRARTSDLDNALRDAQAKVALLEARLAESQSQQAALEALYRELSPSRDELALTEVEQVLALASQQLTLAGNVQARSQPCSSPIRSSRAWAGPSSPRAARARGRHGAPQGGSIRRCRRYLAQA
jgi:chromosome segregation ATPase